MHPQYIRAPSKNLAQHLWLLNHKKEREGGKREREGEKKKKGKGRTAKSKSIQGKPRRVKRLFKIHQLQEQEKEEEKRKKKKKRRKKEPRSQTRPFLTPHKPAGFPPARLRGPGRLPGVLHPGKQRCGTEGGRWAKFKREIEGDNGRWSRDEPLRGIASHRIASPLAAVGSGADAGMLVGQCRHGEGAGWNGTGRERREQRRGKERRGQEGGPAAPRSAESSLEAG